MGKPTHSKRRDATIVFLKGLAIIAVVAHHLGNRRFPQPERTMIAFLGDFTDWCVPLFIVISGYLHALSSAERGPDLGGFFRSRLRRLLLPFLMVALVYSMLYTALVGTGLLADPSGSTRLGWMARWCATLTATNGGVGEQLYFLPLLFLISLFSALILHRIARRPWRILAAGLALLAFGGAVHFFGPVPPKRVYWPLDQLCYGIGIYILGFYIFQLTTRARVGFFTVTAVLSVGAAVLGRYQLMGLIFPLLLLAGVTTMHLRAMLLEKIGEASGTVFLYHTPFLLQPALVLVAAKVPRGLQVGAAYAVGLGVILCLTWLHFRLQRTRGRALTF